MHLRQYWNFVVCSHICISRQEACQYYSVWNGTIQRLMWCCIDLKIKGYLSNYTQQTLPEMQIYCMEQDHSGFVVFGVWNQPTRQIYKFILLRQNCLDLQIFYSPCISLLMEDNFHSHQTYS